VETNSESDASTSPSGSHNGRWYKLRPGAPGTKSDDQHDPHNPILSRQRFAAQRAARREEQIHKLGDSRHPLRTGYGSLCYAPR
jgi:hypothetical protein